MMLKRLNKAFTLIELLVVVAIIAILALIVLLALNPAEMARKSRDSRRLSDLGTLRRAIDLSLSDKQTLPNTAGWITINAATPVAHFPRPTDTFDISKYLSVVPQDPIYDATAVTTQTIDYSGGTCVKALTPKNNIVYQFWSNGDVYVIKAYLESLDSCSAATNDGNADKFYEVGTDPQLDGI